MENTDGNTSAPGGVESADGGSSNDAGGIQSGHPLAVAQENITRAIEQLTYGRRQEAEGAICLLKDAQACLQFYRRTPREGIEGGEGVDG